MSTETTPIGGLPRISTGGCNYEEDEPVEKVRAAFEAGEKHVTRAPAETLTAAADRLEELLADVPHGPWHVEPSGPGRYPQSVHNDAATLVAETFTGPEHRPAEADWIATMDPVVGRALVAMLRAEAALHTEIAAANAGVQVATGGRWQVRVQASTLNESLALARAILGEGETRG